MVSLLLSRSFVQTILYRSLSKAEAMKIRKMSSTTAPFHFFLISMVAGNRVTFYPYLWLIGGWRAISINLGVVWPLSLVMLYIISGNIALVKRICQSGPSSPGHTEAQLAPSS